MIKTAAGASTFGGSAAVSFVGVLGVAAVIEPVSTAGGLGLVALGAVGMMEGNQTMAEGITIINNAVTGEAKTSPNFPTVGNLVDAALGGEPIDGINASAGEVVSKGISMITPGGSSKAGKMAEQLDGMLDNMEETHEIMDDTN